MVLYSTGSDSSKGVARAVWADQAAGPHNIIHKFSYPVLGTACSRLFGNDRDRPCIWVNTLLICA